MTDKPWETEPDRVEWRSAHGYPCLLKRNPALGVWCGYVAVPPGHPWHGDEPDASVHGGVTYASRCAGEICHVPEPGESDDVWWVGFDAAHHNDYAPETAKVLASAGCASIGILRGVYRDVAYMTAECEHLAAQAAAAARGET